jgi:hypothetical protein
LRLVSHGATVLIEVLDGAAQMLRGLLVKLACEGMMLSCVRFAVGGAGRGRDDERRTGGVFEGVVRLGDGVQRMTMRHHRLMRGVVEVFAFLEMPRCFAVKTSCLLVMRCCGFEVFLFTVFRVHACSHVDKAI